MKSKEKTEEPSFVWHTEQRKINDLIPFEHNPRKMSKHDVDELTASLKKYNLVEIPAINLNNKIAAGHQRLRVMQILGRGEEMIDVRVPDRMMTDKEFEEYNIRSNRNHADFDFDELGNYFDKEDLVRWGFTESELGLVTFEEDPFDESAVVDDGKPPKVKLGELWALGRHKLLCGDSTKEEDWAVLMGGEKAQLVFTDAPYNVDYKSPGGLDYASTRFGGTGGKIFNDNLSDDECMVFYSAVLKRLHENTLDDACLYWWYASKNTTINRLAWDATDWHFSQNIIWLKERFIISPGQDFHRCHEPCMFGWKEGKSNHYSNKDISNWKDVFSLQKDDVLEQLDVWYEHRDNTSEYVHPTQKPVRLSERALNKNSRPGDIVIDAFGGSGSTLMGCEQGGRRARLMELDPKYCDAILTRYLKVTSKEPTRVSDGKKWSEVNTPAESGEKLVNA